MNDLFPSLPISQKPALERARQRLEIAQAEYDAADEHEDESGERIPHHIERELLKARREVTALELEAMKK